MWEPAGQNSGKAAVVGGASEIRGRRFRRGNDGSTHGRLRNKGSLRSWWGATIPCQRRTREGPHPWVVAAASAAHLPRTVDPVFAAIERHKKARATLQAVQLRRS